MVKWLIRGGIVIVVSSLCSYLPVRFTSESLTVIFTIIGIMFSLGLSQIMSFSFSDIPNDKYVDRFRPQLRKVQRTFIVLFSISTIFFLLKEYPTVFEWKKFRFDTYVLYSIYQLFCLIYFIENFVAMHNLKESIDDEVRKAKREEEDLENLLKE